jgi:hypothetical protein
VAGDERADRWRPLVTTLLVVLALVALTYGLVGWLDARGVHPAKTLGRLGIGIAVLAALLSPLAWVESWTERRFARAEAALRASRPEARVEPFEDGEERGLRFEMPHERLVLLRPARGLGSPVLVKDDGGRVTLRRPEDAPPPPPEEGAPSPAHDPEPSGVDAGPTT